MRQGPARTRLQELRHANSTFHTEFQTLVELDRCLVGSADLQIQLRTPDSTQARCRFSNEETSYPAASGTRVDPYVMNPSSTSIESGKGGAHNGSIENCNKE